MAYFRIIPVIGEPFVMEAEKLVPPTTTGALSPYLVLHNAQEGQVGVFRRDQIVGIVRLDAVREVKDAPQEVTAQQVRNSAGK